MTIRQQTDALRGSLDLLILKTLSLVPMHGWGITLRIQQMSEGILEVNLGSLYPALQRLLVQSSITGEWGKTRENRRARYYRLTAAGRKQLEREVESYRRVSGAIARILQPA